MLNSLSTAICIFWSSFGFSDNKCEFFFTISISSITILGFLINASEYLIGFSSIKHWIIDKGLIIVVKIDLETPLISLSLVFENHLNRASFANSSLFCETAEKCLAMAPIFFVVSSW
ncbi:unnamed protein product [Blepharisma stoltei]|uniref:Uncharacterized protein n=1 Tax=Blepharisma stoltei TaxID=1481888 RepID=A0AAU9JS99_9CILI|nr:unnamed protein product [Blepharisma stoltei]